MTRALMTTAPERVRRASDRRPGLDVSIASTAGAPTQDGLTVRVRVDGVRPPFRLYLYVDGELAEAWIPAAETNELACPTLGTGRHTVTARAVDALGRWGGATVLSGGPDMAPRTPQRSAHPGEAVARLDHPDMAPRTPQRSAHPGEAVARLDHAPSTAWSAPA